VHDRCHSRWCLLVRQGCSAPDDHAMNCVGPGLTDTPLMRGGTTQAYQENFIKQVPLGCRAQPEVIANVVTFLCTPAALCDRPDAFCRWGLSDGQVYQPRVSDAATGGCATDGRFRAHPIAPASIRESNVGGSVWRSPHCKEARWGVGKVPYRCSSQPYARPGENESAVRTPAS
jgi:hypothetical protein